MLKNDVYAHFHPDERPFINQVVEWVDMADQAHVIKRTDFLDPRQQFIVQSFVNRKHNVQVMFHGGYADAERKRAWIAPDYVQLETEDLNIEVLSITSSDSKIAQLEHGDYMGSLLGLGLKRDKIGDIHVFEQGCHCLAASETIAYLDTHLRQVHRVHVFTEIIPLNDLRPVKVALEERSFSVASLRLDGIVSDALRLSRNKVLLPIKAGECRVNWKVETDPAKPLNEGDMISVRGFGRFKLLEIGGTTKKGRINVTIGRFI